MKNLNIPPRHFVTLTPFLLFLLSPFLSFSQWSTDPAVNNAIIALSGEEAIPKIATCPNGDTYIASFSSDGNYNVRMQRLNAQGVPQWETNGILISDNPQDSWLTDWDICADNANHAILAFPDIRNGGANVVVYRISPSGAFVWGDNGIVLSTGDANYSPKVIATNAGNAIVAWMQDDVIHVQKISPTGSLPWGSSGFTLSQTGLTFSWPQMLPVGSDEFIMKYYQDTGTFPAITRHIYAQRYDAGGSGVWSSPTVVSNAGGIAAWTQVLPFINDGSDGFYIAWHDDRDNNQLSSTWVNHVNSSGVVQFATNGVEASTLGGRNHFYPQLALPPGSSNVFVFWNEMDGDQNNRGIYGQKITSTGTKLWATTGMVFIEISPIDVYPEAARHSPTDVVLFYSEQVSGMNYTLKAFRVDTDGGYVWTPTSKTICSVVSEKVHVETNDFADNQWIMAWEDNRDGESDIYAQNIQLDGTLGPYDPNEGTIEGMVTLVGGTGNLTQVTVTAGDYSTHPDNTGYYSMVVEEGMYDVTGTLPGYYPDTVMDVVVVTDETTSDVDLILEVLPSGYISGNVVISDGLGDVTQVDVTAGIHTVNPDSDGNYTMEIEIGTYDVSASLSGYLTATNTDVVVLEGQTTPDVDFVLDPVPTTGFITGTVVLAGGDGDVTLVDVTAGNVTVHPETDGTYILEIVAGTYEVTASLPGYLTGVVQNVAVEVEQTTPDVDFYLYPIADVGYIEGWVTLDGPGDVTEAVVTAGNSTDIPSENGYYFLALPAGTYTVTADHPYTLPEMQEGIVVVAGQNTENVNFTLEIMRCDLSVRAVDQYGTHLSGVEVDIIGPEDIYTGVIEEDSIVFENVPYGIYSGTAWMEASPDTSYSDDEIMDTDHDMIFVFTLTETGDVRLNTGPVLSVTPNPSAGQVTLAFDLRDAGDVSIRVFSSAGQIVKSLASGRFDAGRHEVQWAGDDAGGNRLPAGIYTVVLQAGGERTAKVLIRR